MASAVQLNLHFLVLLKSGRKNFPVQWEISPEQFPRSSSRFNDECLVSKGAFSLCLWT